MTQKMKSEKSKKLLVKDLNPFITCRLCDGYLIDATTLIDCLHTFCKGCIVKNFETKTCPVCNMDYKKKSNCFRSDPQIQSLVYKLIPCLYTKEIQRRDDFYRSATVRASSSCSDDSVIDKERNSITNEDEDMIIQQVSENAKFLSAEDLISLSLEYYQIHLDKTDVDEKRSKLTDSTNNNSEAVQHKNNGQTSEKSSDSDSSKKDSDKRFLSCPAGVTMRHLQKFVRMKYALTADHRVDIIYKGEVLNDGLSLMDIAYIFMWKRVKPMRFFYRIFTPMKVRPIKIVNTTLSTGGKQLQIVPIKPNSESKTVEKPVEKLSAQQEFEREDEETRSNKEKLFAHLKLQSKSKATAEQESKKAALAQKETTPKPKVIADCVFDYNETDEEIKKFAESRDREWALQKQLDETSGKPADGYHHISKKRKKNKHSKNEFIHKKRKLHAEKITTDELKLKVKLTNGHKHKHHKSTDKNSNTAELSTKEKLLQMRQVRHKTVTPEEKPQVPTATIKVPKTTNETPVEPKPKEPSLEDKTNTNINKADDLKVFVVRMATDIKTPASAPKTNNTWGQQKKPVNTEADKDTFLKTFQSYPEKYPKIQEKVVQTQKDSQKVSKPPLINSNNKSFNEKFANLQQRCTIEPKITQITPHKQEKKVSNILNAAYPAGFTVSKIKTGVKRKAEDELAQDKRPSLEITLINPTPQPASTPVTSISPSTPRPGDKPTAKRPPPATIPLERIKKSINLKSAISIIPKMSDKCDNIGALDLSKHKNEQVKTELLNGNKTSLLNTPVRSNNNTEPKNIGINNLQILSKVASERTAAIANKAIQQSQNNKIRQQIPNLQTLNVPGMPQSNAMKMPKLNEIKFRSMQTQIRNNRPSQNQNIRNIPNPSLLNQNRMNNSFGSAGHVQNTDNKTTDNKPVASRPATIAVETKICEKNEISV